MTACSNETEVYDQTSVDDVSLYESTVNNSNISAFNVAGLIHNTVLSYTLDNFTVPEGRIENTDNRFGYVVEIQKRSLKQLPLHANDKDKMSSLLSERKEFLLEENLIKYFQQDQTSVELGTLLPPGVNNVWQCINYLVESGAITNTEGNIISIICDLAVENEEGNISPSELLSRLEVLEEYWEENFSQYDYSMLSPSSNGLKPVYDQIPQKPLSSIPEGAISGMLLNISLNSANYWNSDKAPANVMKIAPWVAADLGGAALSAIGTLALNIYHDRTTDWGDLLINAAITGATSSCGAWIGKWVKWGKWL